MATERAWSTGACIRDVDATSSAPAPPASDVDRLVIALARVTGTGEAIVRLTHGITSPRDPMSTSPVTVQLHVDVSEFVEVIE